MTADPVWAYCGQRAADRKSTAGSPRHALTLFARLSGAMDAECGEIGRVEVGPWNDADPLNCKRCTAYLADLVVVPEEAAALAAPDARSGTPSVFTDAA